MIMSAFDALGAAAAILQFVDFGLRLGNKAIDVYNSKNGTSRDLQELGKTNEEFQARNDALIRQCRSGTSSGGQAEEALLRIAEKCKQAAQGLADLIEKIRIKGEKTAWKSFVVAVKSERKREEVRLKQQELQRWRAECHEQLLKMIGCVGHLKKGISLPMLADCGKRRFLRALPELSTPGAKPKQYWRPHLGTASSLQTRSTWCLGRYLKAHSDCPL